MKRRGGKRCLDLFNKRWSFNFLLESGLGVGSGRDLKFFFIFGNRISKWRVFFGDYIFYVFILNVVNSLLDLDKII